MKRSNHHDDLKEEEEIPGVSLNLLVKKLVAGKETFLIWTRLVGVEEAKKALSWYGSRILQSLHSVAIDNLGLTDDKDILDWQAVFLTDFGDLCLNHNLLTHSGARSCLVVCLLDLSRNGIRNVNQTSNSAIRYSQALGLLIAKLATRLKFSKDYKDLDTNAELEVAKKLKFL